MKQETVRQLPVQNPPVETGPIRFGNDTAGVFIRADNALAFSIAVQSLLQDKQLESVCPVVWKAQMENLWRLLESSRRADHENGDAMGFAG
jgi:hypothetical protein